METMLEIEMLFILSQITTRKDDTKQKKLSEQLQQLVQKKQSNQKVEMKILVSTERSCRFLYKSHHRFQSNHVLF
jgi:hypothetical protein